MDDLSAAVAGVVHEAALLLDADVVCVVMILDLVKLGPGRRRMGVRQELCLGVLDLLLDLGHSSRHLDCHGYCGHCVLWNVLDVTFQYCTDLMLDPSKVTEGWRLKG